MDEILNTNGALVALLFIFAGIAKQYLPETARRWIPLGLVVIGAGFYLWREGWALDASSVINAIIVGAAATGLHQAGRQPFKQE